MKLVFAAYPLLKHAALRSKSKDWRLGIMVMWPSGGTCLPVDCYFSELALYKNPTKCVGPVQNRHHHYYHHPIEM